MCKRKFNLIEWLYLRQKGNLVYYDQLTGLLNRNYYERVAKLKYLSQEIYVTMVDIDNLKETNDTLGHVSGSKRLKEFAIALTAKFPNELVMRIGGDEFLILSEMPIEDFSTDINEHFSFGTYLKEAYEDISSAISKADKYLYGMKNNHHKEDMK